MKIIPNALKFRLTFRNKIKTKKIQKHGFRQNLGNKRLITLLTLLPEYPTNTCHCETETPRSMSTPTIMKESFWFLEEEKEEEEEGEEIIYTHDFSTSLLFGNFGIAFKTHGKLRASFVETIRLDVTRTLKKKAKFWLRVCCDIPMTERSLESRMGKGKGEISYWEAKIRPGQVFLECAGISKSLANTIYENVKKKSPIPVKGIFSSSEITDKKKELDA
jgi:large subunit ribosomal protein L16